MLENIVIRDAAEADLPAIVTIYNSTIPGRMVTADTSNVSVADRKPWFDAHLADQNRPLWVAELDGKVCGWLSLSTFYGRPAYLGTVEISIYIDESFRGKGLGSYFAEYALQKSVQFGIKTILAFIFGHNAPSLHLFKKLGFERWGTLPDVAELDGIGRDLVILGKRVDR